MTQIKMPEPVAKVYVGNPVRYEHIDAWDLDIGTHMLITTDQAEAYAKARVREALEKAAGFCCDMDYLGDVARAIRDLTQKEGT